MNGVLFRFSYACFINMYRNSNYLYMLVNIYIRFRVFYAYRQREKLPKIYSQDLLINNLFRHPYAKTEFMVNDFGVTRLTATKYLEQLVEHDFLQKQKVGRSNYYVNQPLCDIFVSNSNVS